MSKDLQEWCIENNKEDLLLLWDDSNVPPNKIGCYSHKKCLIKCPRGIHDSREMQVYTFISTKKSTCKFCNSFAQHGIDTYGENFLYNFWDYELNTDINPWKISYSSRKQAYIKCSNELHGSYKIMCNTFSNAFPNNGCPLCHIRGKRSKPVKTESLGYLYPKSNELWGNNDLTPFDVTPYSHKEFWCKCNNGVHDDYMRKVSEMVRLDFRCPSCMADMSCSMLQNKVSNFIHNTLGYTIKHEYDCSIIPLSPTLYNNVKLPYDNEVVELKLIIEVHGSQHYKKSSWHTLTAKRNGTTPEIELQKQQERDKYKKIYAINHGYEYLEIPYYEEDEDRYKQIIMDKINDIKIK